MSRASTTTCDRCGRTTDLEHAWRNLLVQPLRDRDGNVKLNGKTLDLCPACFDELTAWVKTPRTLPLEPPA